uniref:ATPase H+ transporting V0 subunit d1 n=1 Tax=Equus caballus TaxID=9796 RepID=A0A9L0SFI9_HORSE
MSFFPELYFNVDNGYLEGLVRGLKAGVLSQADYLNLVQCETLEGHAGSSQSWSSSYRTV